MIAPTSGADQGSGNTFPEAVTISANGSRQNETSYLFDGGNNIDSFSYVNAPFPFPDAVQEFSVQTSNYSAEYGMSAGGVVNVTTKPGPTDFMATPSSSSATGFSMRALLCHCRRSAQT